MRKTLRLCLAALALMMGLNVIWLSAQDAAAPAPAAAPAAAAPAGAPPATEALNAAPGFKDIVFGGGKVNLLIWVLIFMTSFATLAFIVDGALNVQRGKMLPAHVVAGVRGSLDGGDLGASIAICEQNPGPLSNILMAGFTNISEGFEVVQEAVVKATDLESEKIMQRITYLNLCGQMAPMLGLLGTVTGMVTAFASLANASGPTKDKLLAMAISTALWTTVAGLLISVPALLAFTIYKNLATKVLLESEATVLDLIKILRNAEVEDDAEEAEAGE